MAQKEFRFRGKTLAELKELSLQDFAKLLNARQRRTLTRGLTEQQKKFLKKAETAMANQPQKKPIKTHCREMIVLPQIVGLKVMIYQGKEFQTIEITEDMLGHVLGEFADTRKRVAHSAPGIGATRSSASASVK